LREEDRPYKLKENIMPKHYGGMKKKKKKKGKKKK
jgi:hypothetical protein